MATFTNMATLSYNGNTINSNIVTGTLQEVLTVTKTAVIGDYVANGEVTYVISIINSSATAFTNLTITDDLGAYTSGTDTLVPLTYVANSVRYFIDGVLQATPTVVAGPPLEINGINVPANSDVIIVYQTNANQYAPLSTDGSITNSAVLSGAGLATSITAEETVETRNAPNLSITKSLTPATVTEDGQLTYTFVIQNTGNTAATADDDIVITDMFNPILSNLAVTFNGTVWVEGTNYTYNETTGLFSTIAGQVTVPAATFTQTADGNWVIAPGVSTLIVTGTV